MKRFGFTIHISTLNNLLGERLLRTMWVGTRCLTTCQVAEFLVVFDILQNTNPVQIIDLGRSYRAGPPSIPSSIHSFVQSGRFLRLELKVNEISIAFFPSRPFTARYHGSQAPMCEKDFVHCYPQCSVVSSTKICLPCSVDSLRCEHED